MNEVAEKLESEGMQLGFHNHTIEFQEIDGTLPWNLMCDNTRKEIVMQLDVGNAMMGGLSVDEIMDLISSYPNRSTTVHLKEYSSKNEYAVIGEGEMRWKEFFSLCKSVGGTKWYIVEQEKHAVSSLDSVRKCKEYINSILK
jgi:sugar phosphate isomerase/epimerase